MIVNLIDYLRDRLKTVIRYCFVVLGLLVVWDILVVDKEHAHTHIEHLWGFWSFFGFGACVVIILVSKWIGHCHWFGGKFTIMAREDFYDK